MIPEKPATHVIVGILGAGIAFIEQEKKEEGAFTLIILYKQKKKKKQQHMVDITFSSIIDSL